MEDLVTEAKEDAQPVLLAHHGVGTLPCSHLGLVSIVVLERRDLLVVADM
jgi:hypothetical protein